MFRTRPLAGWLGPRMRAGGRQTTWLGAVRYLQFLCLRMICVFPICPKSQQSWQPASSFQTTVFQGIGTQVHIEQDLQERCGGDQSIPLGLLPTRRTPAGSCQIWKLPPGEPARSTRERESCWRNGRDGARRRTCGVSSITYDRKRGVTRTIVASKFHTFLDGLRQGSYYGVAAPVMRCLSMPVVNCTSVGGSRIPPTPLLSSSPMDQGRMEQAPYAMQGELSTCMAWHATASWGGDGVCLCAGCSPCPVARETSR